MSLIELVHSLSKLLIEFAVLTKQSILELVVDSDLVDSVLEFFLKFLRGAARSNGLNVVEL